MVHSGSFGLIVSYCGYISVNVYPISVKQEKQDTKAEKLGSRWKLRDRNVTVLN